MTAPTTSRTTPVPAARPSDPKARFGDLVAAEWIKLWSLRSTGWSFAVTVALVLMSTVSIAAGDLRQYTGGDEEQRVLFRTLGRVADTFPSGAAMMLVIGAGAIGAITILGEYTSGMIRTTFTVVPARSAVMAAKAAAVTAATTLLGAGAALASYVAAQVVLSGEDLAVGPGHSGVLRLILASVLLAPVSALVGMGVAAVIRHNVAAIVATVALLFVIPSLLNARSRVSVDALHMTVLQAWDRLGHGQPAAVEWPWTAGGACLVLTVWTLVAAALVVFSANRRDQ
ncbi:ABC transporter permease [Kitasatospora sp. NPDC053057]|uniref:ABC transporter permease n=1 Tax=Kitasatospora sp. NPDC053057 TaxID=3364062 RepID=UPI0037CB6CB1